MTPPDLRQTLEQALTDHALFKAGENAYAVAYDKSRQSSNNHRTAHHAGCAARAAFLANALLPHLAPSALEAKALHDWPIGWTSVEKVEAARDLLMADCARVGRDQSWALAEAMMMGARALTDRLVILPPPPSREDT